VYHFDNDDWGEQGEYEVEAQWEEQDEGYQEEDTYESYPTDADLEDPEDPEYEREDPDDENEMLEEDDQDTYE
jgi:hypothetical protein